MDERILERDVVEPLHEAGAVRAQLHGDRAPRVGRELALGPAVVELDGALRQALEAVNAPNLRGLQHVPEVQQRTALV
eukprot:7386370-Prymnesium_polylepis.4